MLPLVLGITAFALYLIYDINSCLWKRKWMRTLFAFGSFLLVLATAIDVACAVRAQGFCGWLDALLLGISLLFAAGLVYSLFFAIPFDETYTRQTDGRAVCRCGVYAMCRHPGILFFFGMYLFAGLAAMPFALLLEHGMIFSVLNLGYAWFQDRRTFPQTFCDYHDYQTKVPFLIPTTASLSRACRTLRQPVDEEVEL